MKRGSHGEKTQTHSNPSVGKSVYRVVLKLNTVGKSEIVDLSGQNQFPP